MSKLLDQHLAEADEMIFGQAEARRELKAAEVERLMAVKDAELASIVVDTSTTPDINDELEDLMRVASHRAYQWLLEDPHTARVCICPDLEAILNLYNGVRYFVGNEEFPIEFRKQVSSIDSIFSLHSFMRC
jgi:hypothetical protein